MVRSGKNITKALIEINFLRKYKYTILNTAIKGRLCSSVAEHWSRKPGVVSSILTGGTFFSYIYFT